MTWRYTNQSQTVVVNDDGTQSCLASTLSAADLAAVLPAAPPPLPPLAQAALDKSDVTIVRCVSAGVVVPAAWQTYRDALRAIANGSDTTSAALPAIPTYPAGT